MQSESTHPAILNMVICDGAHRDLGSGKWTLLGLFNSINAPTFPVTHPQMIIYLALTRVVGKQTLRFQVVAGDRKDEVLYKGDAELSVTEPVPIVDLVISARNISFAKPGEYLLQLYAGDLFLAERPITINKI